MYRRGPFANRYVRPFARSVRKRVNLDEAFTITTRLRDTEARGIGRNLYPGERERGQEKGRGFISVLQIGYSRALRVNVISKWI